MYPWSRYRAVDMIDVNLGKCEPSLSQHINITNIDIIPINPVCDLRVSNSILSELLLQKLSKNLDLKHSRDPKYKCY